MSSDTPSRQSPGSSSGYLGGTEGISGVPRDSLAEDVSSLRADMAKMHEILSRFASEAGGQAARTARNVGQAVVSQVGSTASGLANTGAEMASSATEQFKTFANELEGIARKNPLGALAGALVVGIVIGLIVRGRS
jgi:ElaB/YqjD/DUF883 family membrane-anchored ribosome-binding protein